MRWLLIVVIAGCGSSQDQAPPADAGVDAAVIVDTAVAETFTCAPGARTTVPLKDALNVAGDVGSTLGIFDPAVAYPKDAPGGVMAYSSVPSQDAIFTRIALSADKGATWTYVADANAPIPITAPSTDKECSTCTGRLIHEVSSVVIDPLDDATRRFKLFVHSYFVFPGTSPPKLRYDWGYIGLQTAPEAKGPWSPAQKLLGWASSMPAVSSDGAAQRLGDLPDLAKCVAFTEPSAMVTATSIELALGCVELPANIRVVLLRSTDRAKSFALVGTLLKSSDGDCAGGTAPQVNAAHLFDVGGKPYVIASMAANVPPGFTGYSGCAVYPIEDLATAKIARNADGSPRIARVIATGRFAGACSYAEGAPGYLVSALASESPLAFRIFSSGVAAP